jgi:hypothetical protein
MIEIVPATKEHINALYDEPPGLTVRAIAAVDGEKVLGVAGTYYGNGQKVAFANLTEELRKKPRALVAGARIMAKMMGKGTIARCDANIDKADSFLRHLGFKPLDGDIWLIQ